MAWRKTKNDLSGAADKVLSAALRYLSRRDYASAELRGKLLERGADVQQVKEIIDRLLRQGYLDDARYAVAYTRDRREFRPCGAAAIRHELTRRGVAEAYIEAALDQEYDEEAQRLALRKLLAKAMSPDMWPEKEEQRRKYREKLCRRLLAKGFSQTMLFSEMASLENAQQWTKKNIDRDGEK